MGMMDVAASPPPQYARIVTPDADARSSGGSADPTTAVRGSELSTKRQKKKRVKTKKRRTKKKQRGGETVRFQLTDGKVGLMTAEDFGHFRTALPCISESDLDWCKFDVSCEDFYHIVTMALRSKRPAGATVGAMQPRLMQRICCMGGSERLEAMLESDGSRYETL